MRCKKNPLHRHLSAHMRLHAWDRSQPKVSVWLKRNRPHWILLLEMQKNPHLAMGQAKALYPFLLNTQGFGNQTPPHME